MDKLNNKIDKYYIMVNDYNLYLSNELNTDNYQIFIKKFIKICKYIIKHKKLINDYRIYDDVNLSLLKLEFI
jgi:hypothetical protein